MKKKYWETTYITSEGEVARSNQLSILLGNEKIDPQIIPWVKSINKIDGISTNQCCAGIGQRCRPRTKDIWHDPNETGYLSIQTTKNIHRKILTNIDYFDEHSEISSINFCFERICDNLISDIVFWWQGKDFESAIRCIYYKLLEISS